MQRWNPSWPCGLIIKRRMYRMVVDPKIKSLLEVRQAGKPIIAAGVGSGLTAKGAVMGGADLLAVYNTAVYRIQGLPTALAFLPYDDANEFPVHLVSLLSLRFC